MATTQFYIRLLKICKFFLKSVIMKNLSLIKKYKLIVFCLFFLFLSSTNFAQLRIPFTQRTSQYSPTKKIYNVKGDFTLMGNTNLTLQNYDDNQPNNNNFMRYVDVDNDASTWNSTSSTLQLSSENGANQRCSKIVYAGLYWTGRAAIDNASSTDVFDVSKTENVVNQSINNDFVVGHNSNITNTNYSLFVSQNKVSNLNYPVYTFSGNGNTYVFGFTNNTDSNTIILSINSSTSINIPVSISSNNSTATFINPYIIVDGNLKITINSLVRNPQSNLNLASIQSSSLANVNVAGIFTGALISSRTYDKKVISLKGPNSKNYTQFTANANDIYYPNTTDAYIYSGYKEITDYVRENGIGEYFAADIALKEGNGGGSGYYGGWGMIVVYENQLMKRRDVTIFDGYAFVTGTGNYDLPISGFNTVQSGPVGIKLGLMAAEGDRPFTGDYFKIQKQIDGTYLDLTHSGNAVDNFFNSSIVTGGNPRNPNLLNNTSIDLCMFEIPNTNNDVITNGQTSVNFKYGSTFETFVIYGMAMSVDAYIPEVNVLISAQTINGIPVVGSVITTQPDDIIEMRIQIRNSGNEPINNSKYVVPIPYTSSYVAGSLLKNVYFSPLPSPNNCYFDPTLNSNGSIVWDFGTLPLPANPSVLLADYTFKMKITNDCSILKNTFCGQNASISGQSSGVGAITGTVFSDKDYYIGQNNTGACVGLPIFDPLPIAIDATNFVQLNCQNTPDIREFTFCNLENAAIPITDVAGSFPTGTLFYNQFPVTSTSIQYTINNPFPGTAGNATYIAIPPSSNDGCHYPFKLKVTNTPNTPTPINVRYCLGQTAQSLSATLNNAANTLLYYSSLTGGAQISIIPSTAIAGQFTYYVAESATSTCISEKVAIIVTIDAIPTATAPTLKTIQGCSTAVITDLVYSETPVTLNTSEFLNYGGTLNSFLNTPTISYIDSKTGVCPIVVTRIFTINGQCFNQTFTQIINIIDTTIPTAIPLSDLTVFGCNANFPNPNLSLVAANDNCSVPTVAFVSDSAPTIVGCTETIIRKYSVTNACNNSIFVNQNLIRTIDTTLPTVIALADLNVSGCNANFPNPNISLISANDNCSTPSVAFVSDSAATIVGCTETIIRKYSVTDACGNSIFVNQNLIRTIDTTNPTTNPLADLNVSGCNVAFPIPNISLVSANDNCSTPTVAFVSDSAATIVGCTETIIRKYSVTDACNNSIFVNQNLIRTIDTTLPTANPLSDLTVSGCNVAFPVANINLVSANDNCSTPTVAFVSDSAATIIGCTETIIRKYSVTDACGNSIFVNQNLIRTIDTTLPTANPLSDLTVSGCNANFPTPNVSLLTANDNCSTPTVAFVSDSAATIVGCTETIIRRYSVTDACGNSIFVNQNLIRTIDTTLPTANSLADLTVSGCNVAFPIPNIALVSANDNCSTPSVAFVSDSTPNVFGCTETIIRKYSITDACNNSIFVNQNLIRTIDTTLPTAIALADLAVSGCNVSFPNPNISLVAANDNCSTPTVAFVSDSAATIVGCTETIIRKYSVTDACNNTIFINQNLIRTIDTTAPVLTSATNTNVSVNCSAIPPKPDLIFADTCSSNVNVAYNEVISVPINGQYSIIRTWVASDNCSNANTIIQTINVSIQNNFASRNQETCNLDAEIFNMDDLLPIGLKGLGTWFDTDNSGGILNNNLHQFSGLNVAVGIYNLTYIINDPVCPKKFEVKMKITTDCKVLGALNCVINVINAISPNNDGNNDTFLIENLDCYPENKVEIYNRWGVLVYEDERYDNKNITFSGISNGRTVISKGQTLPSGTYFYILKYKDNNGKDNDKSGYLHLNI